MALARRLVAPVVGFLVATATSFAEAPPMPSARDKAEPFLASVAVGDGDSALDALVKGSLLETQPKQLEVLKTQIRAGIKLYGKYIGIELIEEKTIGKSVVSLTYLMKFEQNPLVWNFVFYRPLDQWQVSWVMFNDRFQGLN